MNQIADDYIRVSLPDGKTVIVNLTSLIQRQIFGIAKIEDDPNSRAPEIFCHLSLRAVLRLGAPSVFLLRNLCLGLQRIAAPSTPMRVNVDGP